MGEEEDEDKGITGRRRRRRRRRGEEEEEKERRVCEGTLAHYVRTVRDGVRPQPHPCPRTRRAETWSQ